MTAVLVMAVALPLLLAAAFLLGRCVQRRAQQRLELSAVTRQHIELFQGGQLNETLVEAAKVRFRELLERGEVAAVEAALRPGIYYAVQIRALTEIGTDDAGRILERQLQRRLSEDQLEQSWYWIDVANGLRCLNRSESLPHLLRCAEAAGEVPLCQFLAAETVCFLGFAGYLRQVDTPLGQAALRVLHRALEGMRFGVPPHVVVEGRLGEGIESLWDHRPAGFQPLMCRVVFETLRLLRRAPQAARILDEVPSERESFDWQISRLQTLQPVLADYLHEAGPNLVAAIPTAQPGELRDLLLGVMDLRLDAGEVLVGLLERGECQHPDLAIQALRWSRSEQARTWLLERGRHLQHSQGRRLLARRAGLVVLYTSLLRALRGHPDEQSEMILVRALADGQPEVRAAAASSLGWWEPVRRGEVLTALKRARRDRIADVRRGARAALARLGERESLQWFRQALLNRDQQLAHETIQLVPSEGLTLLWPDLDQLADAGNSDLAQHAHEAMQQMFEEMEYRQR